MRKSPFQCQAYFKQVCISTLNVRQNHRITNSVDPDQMPHYVASDLDLHCLSVTFYRFPGKNGLKQIGITFDNIYNTIPPLVLSSESGVL